MKLFALLRAAAALLLACIPSLAQAQASPGKVSASSATPEPSVLASPSTSTPAPGVAASPAPAATPQIPSTILAPTSAQDVQHLGEVRQLIRDVQTNTDNVKASGDFGAQLWLIGDLQLFQDWRKPSTPAIQPVRIALRGQPIYTAIIFYGIARGDNGLSSVTYDITVRRPDGSVYDERKNLIGWQGLAPPDARALELGRNYMGININATDPAGLYGVDVLLKDNSGHRELLLKQTFVVQ